MIKLRFGYVNTQMIEKYSGKDDPYDHLAQWTKSWGRKPKLEWVHIFCHTLDTIPMNQYWEMEFRHGIDEWDILWDIFLLTFIFEDVFECIAEALQEIKVTIFKTPKGMVEWTQLDWSTQLCHVLECYNVTDEQE